MSRTRIHFKNTTALVVAGALSKMLMFLAAVMIFKGLSVEDNGVFQLAFSFGFIFSLLTEVGVRGYLLRQMARVRSEPAFAQRLFSDVLNLRLGLIVLMTPIIFLILWLAGYSHQILIVTAWLFLYALLDSIAMLFKFVLRAYERMEFDALFSIIGRGVVLGLIAVFFMSKSLTLPNVIVSHLAGAGLECMGLCIALKITLRLRLVNRAGIRAMWATLAKSAPFAVVNVVGILYLRTGTITLSKLAGERAVALFNTADKLPEAVLFFPMAMVNAVVPFLSRNLNDLHTLRRYYDFLMRYILYVVVGLAVIFIMETQWIILLVAKKEYLSASHAFRGLAVWMVASSIHYATANVLICMNHEKWVMRRYMLVFVFNVILNLLLVSKWGVTGAAIALAVSEVAATAFDVLKLRHLGVGMSRGSILQAAGQIMLMSAMLWVFGFMNPQARIGITVFVAALYVGVVMFLSDRELIRKLLHKDETA